jgi:hypothetical protein
VVVDERCSPTSVARDFEAVYEQVLDTRRGE